MDNESARKAAKNEAISRSLNEGLARGEERWPSQVPTFICECSDIACTQEITVSLASYRTVREHPARFVMVASHMNPEIERKVEETADYLIAEKIGPGKAVAEATA